MSDELNLRKIRWQCRRGMLELDIILEKFFDQQFEKLSANEKQAFVELLDRSDASLYAWLLKYEKPTNSQDEMMVKKIQSSLNLL